MNILIQQVNIKITHNVHRFIIMHDFRKQYNMCNIFQNKITNAIMTWTLVLIEFTYYFNNFFSNNWFHEQTCLCWIQKIFKIIFSKMFYA